jgi:hypothetical protein
MRKGAERFLVVAAIATLFLVSAIAWSDYSRPVRYLSARCVGTGAACKTPSQVVSKYSTTDLLTADGSIIAAVMLTIGEVSLYAPVFLRKTLRVFLLLSSTVLAVLYLSFVAVDLGYFWKVGIMKPILTYWYSSGSFGYISFVLFADAAVTLLAFFLYKGLLGAVKNTLRFLVVPGILVLEVGLLSWPASARSAAMAGHVTNFATWSIGGTYLLSNWTVLCAALIVGVLVYTPISHKLLWTARTRGSSPAEVVRRDINNAVGQDRRRGIDEDAPKDSFENQDGERP